MVARSKKRRNFNSVTLAFDTESVGENVMGESVAPLQFTVAFDTRRAGSISLSNGETGALIFLDVRDMCLLADKINGMVSKARSEGRVE